MSTNNRFSSFAYPSTGKDDSDPDTPLVVNKKSSSAAPGKRAAPKIFLSDDDDDNDNNNNGLNKHKSKNDSNSTSNSKSNSNANSNSHSNIKSNLNRSTSVNTTASNSSSTGSSPWLESRNPTTISNGEKVNNISAAVSQRRVIRSLIPKKLIPGLQGSDGDDATDDDVTPVVKEVSVDMAKIFSKSNLIRDSVLNKALDDNFDPVHDQRVKNAQLRAKERESRKEGRSAAEPIKDQRPTTNKRRNGLDSEEDSEVENVKHVRPIVKEPWKVHVAAIDLTNSPAPVKESKKKRQKVEVESESDGGGWNEEVSKTELKSRANQVVKQCEVVSKTLRKSLQLWEGQTSRDDKDCLNLVSICKSTTGDASKSILSDEDIGVACPGLKLNGYQLVGVNWLRLLFENRVNGVLADDMGLGKTVQTISFLGWLALQPRGSKRPHLIVVPASTLSNWENEFEKFCPSLNVHTYHGSQNERTEMRHRFKTLIPDGEVDVILSTYTIFEREACKQDRGFMYSQKFDYLVLDEAHCIKNADSSRYTNLNNIKTNHRLLLSGTPVQNNLSELLAMLSFLMPSVFGRDDCELMMEAFGWNKGGQGPSGNEGLSMKQLKSMLAPFVLRRLKRDVLDQLSDKLGHLSLLEMPESQKNVYDGIIGRYADRKSKLKSKTERDIATDRLLDGKATNFQLDESVEVEPTGFSGSEAKHLFTALRKAANHPLLLRVHYTDEKIVARIAHAAYEGGYFGEKCTFDRVLAEMENFSDYDIHQLCTQYSSLDKYTLGAETLYDSPKMQHLRELLPKLQSEGHRMLVFSQWTRLLDLLEILLNDMGMPFLRLDGSTPIAERQELIDQYTADLTIPVFLLSTKAGGLGINLTAADTVILHDLDFNPENDKQAEDRCHRIGQTKPVTVYKLVCKGTVDEDIYEMGERKRQLSQAVLSDHRTTDKKKSATPKEDDEMNIIGRILSKALNRRK